jgi:four helix bundle protein
MKLKTFRDLIAWQKAMVLAQNVYQVTKTLPASERFGLTSQMQRAAVSIPSNIAEGHARESRADYIRFLKTARGSLAELQTQLLFTEQLNLLQIPTELQAIQEETDRVLQALIRSLEALQK